MNKKILTERDSNKIIVGFYEDVVINGTKVRAKIDTGASVSSIDKNLAKRLKLGPVVSESVVVSSHGKGVRPVIMTTVKIAGIEINARFNLASRNHLRYSVLIGKNILRKGFIVDPEKKLKKSKDKIIKNTKDLYS
jgi:hypothetical protein